MHFCAIYNKLFKEYNVNSLLKLNQTIRVAQIFLNFKITIIDEKNENYLSKEDN